MTTQPFVVYAACAVSTASAGDRCSLPCDREAPGHQPAHRGFLGDEPTGPGEQLRSRRSMEPRARNSALPPSPPRRPLATGSTHGQHYGRRRRATAIRRKQCRRVQGRDRTRRAPARSRRSDPEQRTPNGAGSPQTRCGTCRGIRTRSLPGALGKTRPSRRRRRPRGATPTPSPRLHDRDGLYDHAPSHEVGDLFRRDATALVTPQG